MNSLYCLVEFWRNVSNFFSRTVRLIMLMVSLYNHCFGRGYSVTHKKNERWNIDIFIERLHIKTKKLNCSTCHVRSSHELVATTLSLSVFTRIFSYERIFLYIVILLESHRESYATWKMFKYWYCLSIKTNFSSTCYKHKMKY